MLRLLKKIHLDKIDNFTFQKQLMGGQASTTLIYKNGENSQIVLKMLIAPRNKPELDAFKNEAKALTQLAKYEGMSFCPKIIGELEQHQSYPIYYYRMEYVEGKTLKEYINESKEPLSWELSLNLTQRISVALGAGSGLYVHRDLHPGNILINGNSNFDEGDHIYYDPGVRILDYGCSKDSFQAKFGEWQEDNFRHLGGISTWSPESIHNPETVDSTHDSWAIGTILYQLITKEYPFQASCFGELIEKHKSLIDLKDIEKKVPYAVLCLLKNLLSIKPNERFRTGEIADICSDILYRDLNDYDNNFVDNYFRLRGCLHCCATCNTMVGGRTSNCPTCGKITNDDNTYPVLRTKDKKFWPQFPI